MPLALSDFFSQIVKVLNTKRQMRNGVGQAAENRRKGIYIFIYIYRTSFCYAWNATPCSHIVTHISRSRWWEGLGFCLGLPAQASFAFLSPVVRGKASRQCTTAHTTVLTFPRTAFLRGTKNWGHLQALEMKGAGSSVHVPNGTSDNHHQWCRNRKSSWIKCSFSLCARRNSLEFV